MLSLVNRRLILVRPTEIYITWLMLADPRYKEADGLAIREGEPTAYLIEDEDAPLQEELDAMLEKHWAEIAEEELSSWYDNPDDWPVIKGVADFKRYFSVQCVEVVFDTLGTPIEGD